MNSLRRLLVLVILGLVVTSCVSKKRVLRLQDFKEYETPQTSVLAETVYKPNDLLTITVSGKTAESTIDFNPPLVSAPTFNGNVQSAMQLQNYLVDNEGYIEFPVLGSLKIGGLTRKEATKLIKDKVSVYSKDPAVNIRILNFSVAVVGEVTRPGNFTFVDERVSILDALSLAGDMTIFGERQNVIVTREDHLGNKTFGELDFTSADVVNSPFYYLQQNDVVLVPPNNAQVQSSGFNRNAPLFVSIAGVIISVITILTRN